MALPNATFRYLIWQNGKVIFRLGGMKLELLGKMIGTVGNVPCWSAVRFIENNNRRHSWDRSSAYYGGPVTIEIVNVVTGERCGLIGLATSADVSAHPRGQLVEG